MNPTKQLTPRIIFLLILCDCVEVIIMFCFKKITTTLDIQTISSLPQIITFTLGALHSPFLWLAFMCMIIAFVTWTTILSNIDLSIAFPLASLSFVIVPVASIIFLHEHISALRWLGIIIICIGITLLSLVPQNSKETS